MPNYYKMVEGNLRTGDIAKSSDINHIQVHVGDMIKEYDSDMHDNESYILGSGEDHKNDFVLTPAPKTEGKYIDDHIIFDVDPTKYININRFDVRQPIVLSKSSIYSIVVQLKNESNKNIPVQFELQDLDGTVLRSNTLTIPKETITPGLFEVVFDLDYYPSAPNLSHDIIYDRDAKDIPSRNTEDDDYDQGWIHVHEEDETPMQFTAGVSQLYFVIKRTELNAIDLYESNNDSVSFDPNTSLGVFCTESSPAPDKNIYCSTSMGTTFEETNKNIWFEEIYANKTTYLCKGGEAVIGGEKVRCMDTHVSIDAGSTYGNVLTHVYLGLDGHLHTRNSLGTLSTDIDSFVEDIDDPMPSAFLPVALILTYSNLYGISKEPLVIQTQEAGQLPLNHHERLRRIEKEIDWQRDIAIPARLKYTYTGEDWVDPEGHLLTHRNRKNEKDYEKGDSNQEHASYYIGTDSNGNPIVRMSDSLVTPISVTLKEAEKDANGNKISLAENDIKNASLFAELTNMVHDASKGTLQLSKAETKKETSTTKTTTSKSTVSFSKSEITSKVNELANSIKSGNTISDSTKKQLVKTISSLLNSTSKTTTYSPWGTYKSTDGKRTERKFTVTKGKNGQNDWDSEFPGMTFYTNTNYKMTKLHIPIYKFKNCSGIKFYIWKRQSTNNKKNTVWFEKKVFGPSKVFSLKKAKVKGGYQYMENGFTINFGKGGLSLPKGQYVIVCLPIPKSGEGSCFVETYKPKNPKDFLIRYHGAANASHFLLKTRYHEVWCDSPTAEVTTEDYNKTGSAVSKTITWTGEDSLRKIETIKPVIGENLKTPTEKCTWKLYADTGAGWQQLTVGEENQMNGGATTFKWKIEFSGDGKDTPVLSYSSDSKYAIQFILTRAKGSTSNTEEVEKNDKNLCLTSRVFDGDDILREYIGDPNFGLTQSRFNQYEFARVWAAPESNKKLLIDIQASDRSVDNDPLWSMHYCDLTLDDFSKINVDYSHYDEELEYDENNIRLKLDSDHSYNDNDIAIAALNKFTKPNKGNNEEEDQTITLTNNSNITKNQILMKSVFENPHDLTNLTGILFKFKVKGTNATQVKGLGIYISSTVDPSPTCVDPVANLEILDDEDAIPPVLYPGEDSIQYYDGKIIKLQHTINPETDGNLASPDMYFRYEQVYDKSRDEYVYVRRQIHDLTGYNLYRMSPVEFDSEKVVEGKDYVEWTARIEVNQNSQNLKFAKEIGIVSLIDDEEENKFSVVGTETTGSMCIKLVEVRGLSEDYYPIFNPELDGEFVQVDTDYASTFKHGELTFDENTYDQDMTAAHAEGNGQYKAIRELKETNPYTHQISFRHQSLPTGKDTQLGWINNPYDGGLSDYKHVGIQIASDVYIPKDCIRIELCEKPNGEEPFMSVTLPTLNTIYDPAGPNNTSNAYITLSQVFKKINSDKGIKSINIVATKYCKSLLGNIVNTTVKGNSVNLFLGKIVVYKAETIPMFHKKMRYKLYSSTNGKIDHNDTDISNDALNIRKLGVVVDYN